ncbi:MAG: ScpA family protein [Egibacteraceae bacterium]
MASYTVSVGSFEGPFDLLLQLIARRKVDIHEVSLAEITDDYLAALAELEEVDLEVTTEFLLVAATLLELKAARLLPDETDPELEELAVEARDLLYARLLDYRTFSAAASWLGAALVAGAGFHPREVGLDDDLRRLRPPPELGVDADGLARLAARAFAERPSREVDVSHLQPVRMTVGEAAELVASELRRAGGQASFAEVTAGCRHPVERIVCFLAVLELYKHEAVDLDQDEAFGDITIAARRHDIAAAGLVVDAYEGRAPDGDGANDGAGQAADGPTAADEPVRATAGEGDDGR